MGYLGLGPFRGTCAYFVICQEMSLAPLNRLLLYSFRQNHLASGYGGGMIDADYALPRYWRSHFGYRGAERWRHAGIRLLKLVSRTQTRIALSGNISRGASINIL